MIDRVPIRRLSSGVPGLDEVLGGGIPEFSLNLIAGGPGCGKTTLGHQIMFANASPERRAVYFTIIGEPPIKMLRYQQQYTFFDATKVGDGSVRFIHLGKQALDGGMTKVLEAIAQEVEASNPGIVVVDSFRSMVRGTLASGPTGELELTDFMQRLALALTGYEATSFLIGEYAEGEHDSAVFTVADGLIWLYQAVERNSVVRKVQVMKSRGQGQIPGLHTARITDEGYSVFPRLLKPMEVLIERPLEHRLSTGVEGLDEMMGGGIPRGYSTLIAGPSGSGKTVLSNQFILEGAARGEHGIVAIFEKRPNDYLHTTPHGEDFEKLVRQKKLEVIYLRPLDLSIDETLLEIQGAVKRLGAKRAVIDSLSGLELALAPTFREDFRESLYRMMGALTGLGVTVMATVEHADSYGDLRFSPQGIAFLTDAIIMQRYVEIDGQLKRALAVVKVRSSQHSKDLREYEISSDGEVVVGRALKGYEGLLTGRPSGGERGKGGRKRRRTR
ncbi:ATPase domain-containing protein [Polyangium mundeleinium]|uniref:non-specific serine/threonine protein kinase n=1 Tax=Polyangium mundeleinium TaxID=2995306 RepID=A0ABT5F530_9BACT|nr:ATPase domain-containing protein [Polyangium mundeleinium]MDC0749188.1 ATPase domain-containing protein [Polyangium mundeleinium]